MGGKRGDLRFKCVYLPVFFEDDVNYGKDDSNSNVVGNVGGVWLVRGRVDVIGGDVCLLFREIIMVGVETRATRVAVRGRGCLRDYYFA